MMRHWIVRCGSVSSDNVCFVKNVLVLVHKQYKIHTVNNGCYIDQIEMN